MDIHFRVGNSREMRGLLQDRRLNYVNEDRFFIINDTVRVIDLVTLPSLYTSSYFIRNSLSFILHFSYYTTPNIIEQLIFENCLLILASKLENYKIQSTRFNQLLLKK